MAHPKRLPSVRTTETQTAASSIPLAVHATHGGEVVGATPGEVGRPTADRDGRRRLDGVLFVVNSVRDVGRQDDGRAIVVAGVTEFASCPFQYFVTTIFVPCGIHLV